MKSYFTVFMVMILTQIGLSQILGFKAGSVFSKIDYFNTWSNNIRLDKIHFGYFAEADMSYLNKKKVELNSTVGFVWGGGRGEIWKQEIGTFDAKASMGFLSISSQARIKLPVFKSAVFYLGVGPRVDIPLMYKEDVYFFEYIEFWTNNSFNYFETSGGISDFLYGIKAETGYRFQRSKNNFSFYLSYNYNSNILFDLYRNHSGNQLELTDRAKLNYVTFGFGWGFNKSNNK